MNYKIYVIFFSIINPLWAHNIPMEDNKEHDNYIEWVNGKNNIPGDKPSDKYKNDNSINSNKTETQDKKIESINNSKNNEKNFTDKKTIVSDNGKNNLNHVNPYEQARIMALMQFIKIIHSNDEK